MKIVSESQSWCEVKLSCGQTVLISKQDRYLLDVFPYWFLVRGYVRIQRYLKTEYGRAREEYYLHKLITQCSKGFEVDHKNRNKLDNRRENLRLATRNENQNNKAKAKGTTSKFRGVAFSKSSRKNPWVAYISKHGQRYELGYFKTQEEAALAYNKKSLELWGEFAFVNEV